MTSEELALSFTDMLKEQNFKVAEMLAAQESRAAGTLEAHDLRFSELLKAQDSRVEKKLETLETKLIDMLDAQTLKIALLIENTVTKRLDALFDGYTLTHEKQSELENRVASLEERVERLEIIAG